ncbi:MAG TPA: glutamate--tRNA ligase [Gammaproteobacteria bacterium]|nr:glutamate--tRNA ligase [Gammaproteobacteria bacterium]
MSAPVRTRFAPSPTGFLHLGNVRTALLSALAAQHADGAFVIRIEDTDATRSRPEWADALLDDLRWLGLEWAEGPDVGGPRGPYRQSERAAIYADYFDRLTDAGLTYPCFCTPEELAASRAAQRAAGQPPRYAGTCAGLAADEVEAKLQKGLKPALRFRVPPGRELLFDDLVRGPQTFASDAIGDFVIRRADGTPAFFFCNALDDALMGITHVLRGEDHLANTPRQMLLLEALDLVAPRYGHLGLLVGDDGTPLSKRHGSASLRELREQGFLPGAVLNYLARLGHHYADDPGYADVGALAAAFDFSRLGSSPAHFDADQLRHWQKEAVAHTSDEALWAWMSTAEPDVAALVPPADAGAFVHAVRDNVVRPHEARHWAQALYSEVAPGVEARAAIVSAAPGFFEAALESLVPGAEFKSYVKQLGAAAGVKGKQLYMPLRAALTRETHGPELARVWNLLGPDRIRTRLENALKLHANESR